MVKYWFLFSSFLPESLTAGTHIIENSRNQSYKILVKKKIEKLSSSLYLAQNYNGWNTF